MLGSLFAFRNEKSTKRISVEYQIHQQAGIQKIVDFYRDQFPAFEFIHAYPLHVTLFHLGILEINKGLHQEIIDLSTREDIKNFSQFINVTASTMLYLHFLHLQNSNFKSIVVYPKALSIFGTADAHVLALELQDSTTAPLSRLNTAIHNTAKDYFSGIEISPDSEFFISQPDLRFCYPSYYRPHTTLARAKEGKSNFPLDFSIPLAEPLKQTPIVLDGLQILNFSIPV